MTNITRSFILHLIGDHPLARNIIKDWGKGQRTWEEAMMDVVKVFAVRLERLEHNISYLPKELQDKVLKNDTRYGAYYSV